MPDEENRIFSIRYDFGDHLGPWIEVVAADADEAQRLTEPPRDADGRRTWRRALLGDVTPAQVCPL